MTAFTARISDSLDGVPPADWDRLAGNAYPFTRHAFLAALERNGCLEPYGWYPQHVLVHQGERLVGAAPMYVKDNAYGELVFDWQWAAAYERYGRPYYPKLVVAIPYTPATGPRLLSDPHVPRGAAVDTIVQGILDHADRLRVSSVHVLFPGAEEAGELERHGFMTRLGTQFHWENRGYADFDAFLAGFSAQKRKKVRRERRRVAEAGVELELLHGGEVSEEQWRVLHDFYASTFERKSGYATLSPGFFREVGRTLPDQVVLVLARHAGEYVAGTFNLRGADTFYGRHWGCREAFHSLHFEACYYQPLDYCIAHGLARFEAGAQGEHKLSRGFLPRPTYSAHYVFDPMFRRAIADFLRRERQGLEGYMELLDEHSPYRRAAT
jgi:predicted N-acyltransferase